jgi:protein TonB
VEAQIGSSEEVNMLQDALIQGNRNFATKVWVFPLSFAAHAVIVALLVTLPLFNPGQLPRLELRDNLVLTVLPPSPPPPPPKKAAGSPARRIKPVHAKSAFDARRFVVPLFIPDEIADIPFSDIGIEGGTEGGVEGGVPGGALDSIVGPILGNMIGVLEAPVRAIGEIRVPRLVKQVEPSYPEIARQARVEGIVILEAATDMYGRVQTVKVLRSIPLLDQAAMDAVRQWVYEPMIINGRPRGVIFTVTVRFKLQ